MGRLEVDLCTTTSKSFSNIRTVECSKEYQSLHSTTALYILYS